MWDGIATDECGEDVSDNLIHGDAVSHAWHDGVSEWLLAVAATERPYINFPVFGSEAVVTRGRTDVGKCDAAVR
jgi:hypothetical protein